MKFFRGDHFENVFVSSKGQNGIVRDKEVFESCRKISKHAPFLRIPVLTIRTINFKWNVNYSLTTLTSRFATRERQLFWDSNLTIALYQTEAACTAGHGIKNFPRRCIHKWNNRWFSVSNPRIHSYLSVDVMKTIFSRHALFVPFPRFQKFIRDFLK